MSNGDLRLSNALFVIPLVVMGFSNPGKSAEITVVTPEKSAVVTAKPISAADWTPGTEPTFVEISVLGFKPPETGFVQAVVRMEAPSGEVRELGRFGLFPNEEFKAKNQSEAQRFIFRLPTSELAKQTDTRLTIKVDLVPFVGTGKGARLDLGEATILKR